MKIKTTELFIAWMITNFFIMIAGFIAINVDWNKEPYSLFFMLGISSFCFLIATILRHFEIIKQAYNIHFHISKGETDE